MRTFLKVQSDFSVQSGTKIICHRQDHKTITDQSESTEGWQSKFRHLEDSKVYKDSGFRIQ